MTASVTHNKVVLTPDDGTSEVGTDEWNAEHDISIAPADIGASADDHDHDAAYDTIGAAGAAESAAEGYADGAVSDHAGATDPHGDRSYADGVGSGHTGDTSGAHAASAIAFTPNGSIAATDVQAAIQEVRDEAGGGGAVATDAIWDAAGDIAVGTGADTADNLAITVPAANILNVLGVVNGETTPTWKSVHDATAPVNQAFGDSAAAGTALTAAHRDHKHGMPAAPTTIANDTAWAAKGDIVVATANDTAAVLTAPTTRGQRLGADAAGNIAWAPHQSGPSGYRVSDDMMYWSTPQTSGQALGNAAVFIGGTNSGLVAGPIVGTVSHPGIIDLQTGSTSTGSVIFVPAKDTSICLGGGRARFGAWVNIPVLGTSAKQFEIMLGFADGGAGAVVDGCYFSYKDTLNSGAWSVTTVANSVSTLTVNTTTGTTALAATWYLLEVEVNAAGTAVDYYVNGAAAVQHTANIPVGVGRETGSYIHILKSVGATASHFYLDAYYLELDFTTPR